MKLRFAADGTFIHREYYEKALCPVLVYYKLTVAAATCMLDMTDVQSSKNNILALAEMAIHCQWSMMLRVCLLLILSLIFTSREQIVNHSISFCTFSYYVTPYHTL